jgi:hypothetical protein
MVVIAMYEAGLGFVCFALSNKIQRLEMAKTRCDFWEHATVTKNRGMEIVVIEPSGEGHLVIICFMLMTS